MSAKRNRDSGLLRVLWLSHGYGYGGDLLYFGEIFREFRVLFPSMAVAVDRDTRFINRYDIRLLPMMRFWRRAITRRTPDGQSYETEVVVPSPLLLPRLLAAQVDVVITIEFTIPALIAALARSLSFRKRLVLLIESDPAARGASANKVVLALKRWAVRQADAIQTNNDRGRRYLVEDLRADPAIVRVAPYLTSRPPGPATDVSPRPGPVRMLFANSINPRKGLRQLLEALALVEPAVRDEIDLTVVGDGPEREELEGFAQGLGMGKRLRFVGRRPYHELGDFYAAADVLAIPSLADYRSLAGFEGLGYGLALLASMHDGATEETIPADGGNGFIVDPFDIEDLAASITRMASDKGRVEAMRRASLDLYERRFSLEAVAQNLSDTIEAAVQR